MKPYPREKSTQNFIGNHPQVFELHIEHIIVKLQGCSHAIFEEFNVDCPAALVISAGSPKILGTRNESRNDEITLPAVQST